MKLEEKRAAILAAADRPFRDVPTPEWESAGTPVVRIISMSADDRDSWEAAALIARARESGTARLRGLRAELVVRCAQDPATGEALFREEDIPALGQKSAKVVGRLFTVASELNAVSEADVKGLEKNSAGGLSGDSLFVLRWLQVASTWIGSFGSFRAGRSPSGSPSKVSKAIH